jgi:Flp pilus assembly protein TadG
MSYPIDVVFLNEDKRVVRGTEGPMTRFLRRGVHRTSPPGAAKHSGGQWGQSTIEVVMIAPLLLLLVMVTFEFGRVLSYWVIVTNAAREGARYGVTQAFNSSSNSTIMSIVQGAAQGIESNQPLTGMTACQGNNQIPSGSTSCIGILRITCPNASYTNLCGSTSDQILVVVVQYQVVRWWANPVSGSIQVTGLSIMRQL